MQDGRGRVQELPSSTVLLPSFTAIDHFSTRPLLSSTPSSAIHYVSSLDPVTSDVLVRWCPLPFIYRPLPSQSPSNTLPLPILDLCQSPIPCHLSSSAISLLFLSCELRHPLPFSSIALPPSTLQLCFLAPFSVFPLQFIPSLPVSRSLTRYIHQPYTFLFYLVPTRPLLPRVLRSVLLGA